MSFLVDLAKMIDDMKPSHEIVAKVNERIGQAYNQGFKDGERDARSRDWSARNGHDMGQ